MECVRFGSAQASSPLIVLLFESRRRQNLKKNSTRIKEKFLNKTKHKNKTWRFFFKGDCERFSSSSTKRNNFDRIYIIRIRDCCIISFCTVIDVLNAPFRFIFLLFLSYLFLPNLGNLCSVPPPGLIRITLASNFCVVCWPPHGNAIWLDYSLISQ